MRGLIRFWVERPLLVNLSTAFILFAGLLTLGSIKYEVMPHIDLGIINITTLRPGAGPEDVELSISVPLEEEIIEVDGLKKVYSASMEGISVLTIGQFRDPREVEQVIVRSPQPGNTVQLRDIGRVVQLRERVKQLEGYKSIIVEPIKDTPVAGKPVELEIIGNDAQRYAVGDVLQDYLRSYPGVTEVWTSYKPGKDLVELVLLFNSLTQPFLILLAIPFGLAGVVVGFSLQGLPLSLIALIGLLGLIGVLVNDSLVMVHSLNRIAREQNAPLSDEQLASGAGRRLRPILITSLTTVAGLFPTAYGLAGSNPFITPMVMAMAWGILFGTVISLLLLPCLYAADRDIKMLWARLRAVRPRPVR